MSIKNHYEQKELEQFLKDNAVTEDIYIGATKDGNQWFWGDKSPVFVACKFKKALFRKLIIRVLNEILIFVVPHDKTDQTTVAVSAKVWNGWEADYAIDGMINTNQGAGDSASIHQYHYMTITLPEVMVVRAVRLFSSAVSFFYSFYVMFQFAFPRLVF